MRLTPGERLVVDASVAVKSVVPEPDSARAAALRNYRLIAPDLFFAECSNVLWKKLRRGSLTSAQAGAAARIATEIDHPAYDAMYLAVAEAFGSRLVTADSRLVRRAEQRRSPLLGNAAAAFAHTARGPFRLDRVRAGTYIPRLRGGWP